MVDRAGSATAQGIQQLGIDRLPAEYSYVKVLVEFGVGLTGTQTFPKLSSGGSQPIHNIDFLLYSGGSRPYLPSPPELSSGDSRSIPNMQFRLYSGGSRPYLPSPP